MSCSIVDVEVMMVMMMFVVVAVPMKLQNAKRLFFLMVLMLSGVPVVHFGDEAVDMYSMIVVDSDPFLHVERHLGHFPAISLLRIVLPVSVHRQRRVCFHCLSTKTST